MILDIVEVFIPLYVVFGITFLLLLYNIRSPKITQITLPLIFSGIVLIFSGLIYYSSQNISNKIDVFIDYPETVRSDFETWAPTNLTCDAFRETVITTTNTYTFPDIKTIKSDFSDYLGIIFAVWGLTLVGILQGNLLLWVLGWIWIMISFSIYVGICSIVGKICNEKIIEYLPDEILWFIDKDATNIDRGFLDLDLVSELLGCSPPENVAKHLQAGYLSPQYEDISDYLCQEIYAYSIVSSIVCGIILGLFLYRW